MFTLLIPPDYRAAQVNELFMKCLYPGKCYRRLRREFPSRVTNSYYVSFSSLLLGSSRTLINARGPINRLAALNELIWQSVITRPDYWTGLQDCRENWTHY